jgi:hypothetical protein
MTQPTTNSDGELDDPGRDPIGLEVPRNPLGGPDQDTGRGTPRGDDGDAPGDHDAAAGGAAQP